MVAPKKSLRRRWTARAGGIAFRIAQLLCVRKNPVAAERVGRRLGRIAFRLGRKHRRRALSNLRLVFPEMSESERRALAIRCFEHYGMFATDFLRAGIRSPEEFAASVVEVEGLEQAQAFRGSGRGILLISGHFGNFERLAHYFVSKDFQLALVQRDANDEQLNRQMTELRSHSQAEVLSRGNAARAILTALKQDKAVYMLADQNCSESIVPFLGLPTGTVLGPAVLQKRTGCPLLMTYCVRVGPAQFKMIFEPPLEPLPEYEDPILGMTAALNASLERMVRRYPEQWLWLHDRWKSVRRQGLVGEP